MNEWRDKHARRRQQVLLIDSDLQLAKALAATLAQSCTVQHVTDVPDALAALDRQAYNLVVLDLILPSGTGFEVLEALAGRPQGSPVALVASALVPEVDLTPYARVVVGHLAKPFGEEEFAAAVHGALAGRRPAPEAPPRAASVLLVDDHALILDGMAEYLRSRGYRVQAATSAPEALEAFSREPFDAVACDWILPRVTGLELLGQFKAVAPQVPVLILTGHGTPELIRRACAAGAADVLVKPFPLAALPMALEKSLQQAARAPSVPPHGQAPRRPAGRRDGGASSPRYSYDDIIGDSVAIRRARHTLQRAATLDSTVLIYGETGTGKELFAQTIHQLSARSTGPFVAVNAAAIPDSMLESELFGYAPGAFTGARKDGHQGKFLQANGGTLFLDEIGDLPLGLQAKLLRVLQEGEVDVLGGGARRIDVRVVAATHRDLSAMAARGTFRNDLYYRLNVITLTLPPLRERPEDIPLLVRRFLADLGARYGRPGVTVSAGAMAELLRYPWPGNVRELRNVMEQVFAFSSGDVIHPVHLPPGVRRPGAAASPEPAQHRELAHQEREAILRALKAAGGNKVTTAKLLGISRAGLYVKLKVYGIS